MHLLAIVGEFRLLPDALGVRAPFAAQRTELQKHVRADAGTVVGAEMLDVENEAFGASADIARSPISSPRQMPTARAMRTNSLSGWNGPHPVDRLAERHELKVGRLEGDHHAGLPLALARAPPRRRNQCRVAGRRRVGAPPRTKLSERHR